MICKCRVWRGVVKPLYFSERRAKIKYMSVPLSCGKVINDFNVERKYVRCQ